MKELTPSEKQFAFHLSDTLGLVQKHQSANHLWEVLQENNCNRPEIVARSLIKACKERQNVFFDWSNKKEGILTRPACLIALKELGALPDASAFHYLLSFACVFEKLNTTEKKKGEEDLNVISWVLAQKTKPDQGRTWIRPILGLAWSTDVLNEALLNFFVQPVRLEKSSDPSITTVSHEEVFNTLVKKGAKPELCRAPGAKGKPGLPLLATTAWGTPLHHAQQDNDALKILASYLYSEDHLQNTLHTSWSKLSYLAIMARNAVPAVRDTLNKALDETKINWWDGDPHQMLMPLLMEIQSSQYTPPLLELLLKKVNENPVEVGLPSENVLPVMKRLSLSMQAFGGGQEPKMKFWTETAPLFAALWKASVDQNNVQRWVEEMKGLQSAANNRRIDKLTLDSFFERKDLEYNTPRLSQPRVSPRL